jgi:hypothetical protein
MTKLWTAIGLSLALFLAGAAVGWKARGPEVTRAKAETAKAEAALVTAKANAEARVMAVEKQAKENAKEAEAKLAAALARVQVRIKEVDREIPVYIPAEADRAYPLPRGFVCVLNQAAASYPGSPPTPGPACESPGSPSTITASNAAATLTDWASLYYAECERVKAWQEFYKAQQKAFTDTTRTRPEQ